MTSLNIVTPNSDADDVAASIAECGHVIIEELAPFSRPGRAKNWRTISRQHS